MITLWNDNKSYLIIYTSVLTRISTTKITSGSVEEMYNQFTFEKITVYVYVK